jgi:hypothetical protein
MAVAVLAATLTSVSTRTTPPSHLDQLKLKGKVKSLTETTVTLSQDSSKLLNSKTIRNFNKMGMLIEILEFNNQKLTSKKIYNYSSENKLLNLKDYNPDGSLYLLVNYYVDKNGFTISKKYDRSSQRFFDEKRQKADVEYEKYYNSLFTEVTYKCDFKGYKLEEKYTMSDGSLSHMYTYKYDFKYNLCELKYYNSSNKLAKRVKYKYNKKGDIAESKTFISNRLAITSAFSYDYDLEGNWLKKVENKDVEENIFTTDISNENTITERIVDYY